MANFKNNPGCNCCLKVLVWDMGSPAYQRHLSGRNYYQFMDSDIFYDTYDEENIIVHEAIPRALLEANNRPGEIAGTTIYGGNFWNNNPNYDPYADPPPNDDRYDTYWSRNINDYHLIFWVDPLSPTLRTWTLPPCDTGVDRRGDPASLTWWISDNFPDHRYADSPPEWWDEVANGSWSGRVVIYTGFNGKNFNGDLGYHTNLHLELAGIFDDIGMDIDPAEEAQLSLGTPDTIPPRFCGITSINPVASDLTEGVTEALLAVNGFDPGVTVHGGQPLVRVDGYQMIPRWCNFDNEGLGCGPHNVTSRNRVARVVDGTTVHKDFVLHSAGLVEPGEFQTQYLTPGLRISLQNWYKNLYNVPIEPPSTGSG